ncbi:hypothetical protein GOV10_01095 [Candidatus Woesearchaeota archaeon]|nr:hypothetical protein [Candidatus Woesearchaeota archaeon]
MGKNIYMLCPVRKATKEEKQFLDQYVADLEAEGHSVHYPPRDADQSDPSGLEICLTHYYALRYSDEAHIYWTGSEGSVFDFGMIFMAGKPIVLINDVERTPHKSYTNVVLDYAK